MRLAMRIGHSWFAFGIYLGMTADVIKAIERRVDNMDSAQMAFVIINLWRQIKERPESVNTYYELTHALEDINRVDLVRFVRHGE